jgi:hypothetical protein
VLGVRDPIRIEQAGGEPVRGVGMPGLDEENLPAGILAESSRQDGSGRATSDDDDVSTALAHRFAVHAPSLPSVQICSMGAIRYTNSPIPWPMAKMMPTRASWAPAWSMGPT